ncbi:hypothetical protein JCM33374_g2603 [Metschnikowia sp. JCM 33374]|nr:hypothetical protein JCM33374_g2603 [Metschnikowia sp. JCM 33374]
MTPSTLENYLDEFSTRYLESCEEVYASQTRTGMLLSRLSSPLSVIDIPEPASNERTPSQDMHSQGMNSSAMHSSTMYSPELIRPQFSRPVAKRYTVESDCDQMSIFSSQSSPMEPGFSPQSSISSSSSSSSSPSSKELTTTVGDRTFTKLNIVRPKTKGKLLRGTTNVGNPFYNRKGSIIRRDSTSSLNSR